MNISKTVKTEGKTREKYIHCKVLDRLYDPIYLASLGQNLKIVGVFRGTTLMPSNIVLSNEKKQKKKHLHDVKLHEVSTPLLMRVQRIGCTYKIHDT